MADLTSSYVLPNGDEAPPFSPKASLGEETTSPIHNANPDANTPAPHATDSYTKLVLEETAATAFPVTDLEEVKVTPEDGNASRLLTHQLDDNSNSPIKSAASSAENNEAAVRSSQTFYGNNIDVAASAASEEKKKGSSIALPPPKPKSPSYQTLAGKVALVTGASRGIGAGIALELGARGASIIVNYVRGKTGAEAIVSQIEKSGSRAIAVQADVSKVREITSLFEAGLKHFGQIDFVISNSGTESFDKTEEITEEKFDHVFGLNVRAQFFVGQHAYKYCQAGGRLVLMSSIAAGLLGVADHALYSGSKSAVNGIVKSFATDFGTKGITVNAIAPGGVKSDMFTQVAWRYIPGAKGDWPAEEIERAMAENCPLKRCADPVDVARVVAFLVGEDGGWVNGKLFFNFFFLFHYSFYLFSFIYIFIFFDLFYFLFLF